MFNVLTTIKIKTCKRVHVKHSAWNIVNTQWMVPLMMMMMMVATMATNFIMSSCLCGVGLWGNK